MKKMTLDLDSLVVESFDTSSRLAGRGTIQGHDSWEPVQSVGKTACLCPVTSVCIQTVDYATCVVTACNDVTCTCQPDTIYGDSCDQATCRLTLCVNTCARCDSFTGQVTC